MTERHPPPRYRHFEEAAERYPIQRSPEKVGAGGVASATVVGTSGSTSSGEPEGC